MTPRPNKAQVAINAMEARSAAASHISDAVCDAALAVLHPGRQHMHVERDWIRPAIAAAFDAQRREGLGGQPAKQALLEHMLAWSEGRYSAGWLVDLEHTMARDGADTSFRWLVEEAGGWWTFNEDWKMGDDPETIRLFVPGTFEELVAQS